MKSFGNRLAIYACTGATPSIARNAVPLIIFDNIVSNDVTGLPHTNNMVVTVDNLRNDVVLAKFLKDNVTAESATTGSDTTLEDGVVIAASSGGTDPSLIATLYGGLEDDLRQVFIGTVKVTTNSGNFSTAGGDYTKKSFEISFVKAGRVVTLPDATVANISTDTFYPQTHVTTGGTASAMPAPATLLADESCVEVWIGKGTKTV